MRERGGICKLRLGLQNLGEDEKAIECVVWGVLSRVGYRGKCWETQRPNFFEPQANRWVLTALD